jgi:hypothetical protein
MRNPGERSFYDPSFRKHLKALAVLAALDDL